MVKNSIPCDQKKSIKNCIKKLKKKKKNYVYEKVIFKK